jgi:hypothetical protein
LHFVSVSILPQKKKIGYSKSLLPLIKNEDYEVLYGLILGDLYIKRFKSENASLRFEQSLGHKEYLKHLFEKFKYLCTKTVSIKTSIRKNKIYKTPVSSVYFGTRQLTSITELHTLFYCPARRAGPIIGKQFHSISAVY